MDDRCARFWKARRDAVSKEVDHLYARHRSLDPTDTRALLALFMALPCDWQVVPAEFGLSVDDVFAYELRLWENRLADLHDARHTIEDEWQKDLDVVKLFPFFLAVVLAFAEHTGIAREFFAAFFCSMAGWICHKDLHAQLDPAKPEDEVRCRIFCIIIGATNAGKSPFWRKVLGRVFTGVQGRQSMLQTHKRLFGETGKGLYLAKATQGDFAKRMHETDGLLFWSSQEGWGVVDTPWACGKKRVQKDKEKVDYSYLLGTQNGWEYGPVSIKSEKAQYHVATTNFGMFHAAQPRAIHEFWGAVFTPDCPFSGMGWENRPTFWWARSHRNDDESRPQVTSGGLTEFTILMLTCLAASLGHMQGHRNFHATVIKPEPAAGRLWGVFTKHCEAHEKDAPPCAQGAVGKHCFTTTSHLVAAHLLQSSFSLLKANPAMIDGLLAADAQLLSAMASFDLPQSLCCMRAEIILHAPAHIAHMTGSMVTMFNEMCLPVERRAGPPIATPSLQSVQRETGAVQAG